MAHADGPSTQPGDQRSICHQASRCCRPAAPARIRAVRSSSAVWQASDASLRGQHANAPCGFGIRGCRRGLQRFSATPARSSMAIDGAAWQSPELLPHGQLPVRSAHARPSKAIALWAQRRTGQGWKEAYRRIVGTSEFRRPWPHRRSRLESQRSIRSQLLLLHQHLRFGRVATTA